MGCGSSKIDDLPLVTLCRERKQLIKAASDHRYVLAAAHVAYFQSLKDVGEAIKRFVDEELVISSGSASSASAPDSPVLRIPAAQGKGKSRRATRASDDTSLSHSKEIPGEEDSHLHISDSDSDLDSSSSGHIHFEDEDEDDHDHDSQNHRHSRVNVGGEGEPYQGDYRYFTGDNNYQPQQANWEHPPPGVYNYPQQEANWEHLPPAAYNYPQPQANWEHPPPGAYNYPQPQANWEHLPPAAYNYPQPEANWGAPPAYNYPPPQENWGSSPFPSYPSNVNMHYMKKAPTQSKSFIYEEPGRYHAASTSTSDSGYGYPSSYQPSGGFFGSPMGGNYGYGQPPSPPRPPPAPPSPPKVSNWDYLNVFDSYNVGGYSGFQTTSRYGSTTSSPDSKEVREREGIPDLEDETENEVLKRDVRRGKKKKMSGEDEMNYQRKSGESSKTPKAVQFQSSTSEGNKPKAESQNRGEISEPSVKGKDIGSSYNSPDSIVSLPTTSEEGSVKKKGVSFEVEEAHTEDVESSNPSSLSTLSVHGTRDLREVVSEIKNEFETASSYGKEVAALLEVGRLPYLRRNTPLKVIFSRILYFVAPSMLSSQESLEPTIQLSSRIIKLAKAYPAEPEKDFDMNSGNLSLTLEKLYAWEKKLYKEVKDEERLRVSYEKQCKKLKILSENGAEGSKIEATQASIKRLLTKIDICIRAVDAISSRIQELRDKELRPQLNDLIHGLTRMWKAILKCHQKQFQAITESKFRSLKANTGFQKDSGLKATVELEMELLNWCDHFNKWVNTQKCYAQSLNEWLMRCLLPEPEITADGVAPFSPGRAGAPPIFVICNDWSQSMARISEKSVGDAMRGFASNLHELWERQDEEQRQRIKAEYLTNDFEKQLRTLRMEKKGRTKDDQDAASEKSAMSKVLSESGVSPLDDLKVDLDTMRKKLEDERMRHKEAIKLVHSAASSSLQGGLIPIFEALGNFTSEVVKAHEQVRLQN